MSNDKCGHIYRKATAVNYFNNEGFCLFPVEHIECIGCGETWILTQKDGKAECVPFPAAGKVLSHWADYADKEWLKPKSDIINPFARQEDKKISL